ncbi:MAG: hypothetical protein J6K03_08165 [Oscillospiraceae bacterium]|nr:hypothetical protein [Oscillospiraceae bacterium]
MLKIELTAEQHTALMEHLNELSELYYTEAAAFAHLGEIGRETSEERIRKARSAFSLYMELSKY